MTVRPPIESRTPLLHIHDPCPVNQSKKPTRSLHSLLFELLSNYSFRFSRTTTQLTWAYGCAVALLNVGTWTGTASVEWRRIGAQASAFLSPASASVRMAGAGAFGPRRPRRPTSVHCKSNHQTKRILVHGHGQVHTCFFLSI